MTDQVLLAIITGVVTIALALISKLPTPREEPMPKGSPRD